MLAYYTSIVKKEDLLIRLSEDLDSLAELSNELVCEIKVAAVTCKNKNIEDTIEKCRKAEELSKIISAMIKNVSSNLEGYLETLTSSSTQKNNDEEKQQQSLDPKEPAQSDNQLGSILEAIKSLKEMKATLDK